jgi:hypothetical protein
MSTGAHPARPAPPSPSAGHRLPPVEWLAVASMALVIAGGIDLAAHLPRLAPLGPAVGLLAAAGGLLLAGVGLLARLREFAWRVFAQVSGCALVAYLVIAGMLEFVFVFDHTQGGMLVVVTLSLAVFALDIPLLLGFTVARYASSSQGQPGPQGGGERLAGAAPERDPLPGA